MIRRLLASTEWFFAALLGLFLPFTSFPLVARLTGSTMVAPLSILPAAILAVIGLLPFLLRAGSLPVQVKPLLGFLLAALLASALAFFRYFPPYAQASVPSSVAGAVATLAVGLLFYFVVVVWSRSPDRLRFLLRWINWSGLLMLAWSFYQSLTWYRLGTYPDWMWNFQAQVSTSELLYVQRVNGFAYEPSWLAHQLNMLYLPFWLAAAVSGFTAHTIRLGKIHLEHFLLLGGIAALVLSISRIGLLTFLLMVVFLLFLLNIRLVGWLQNRLSRHLPPGSPRLRSTRRATVVISVITLVTLYAGLAFGAAYALSRYDARMARLFDFSTIREQSLMHYANQLVFAERLVFWEAGWRVFEEAPAFGVGLGNAGYFFPETLSPFSWALTEIRQLMYQQSVLPNIKSLWVRLLAETGIVGFAFFLSWCYLLWRSASFLIRLPGRLQRMVGLMGSFALIGFLVEGFSIDSFALPYYWVTFGILTAACEIARLECLKEQVGGEVHGK